MEGDLYVSIGFERLKVKQLAFHIFNNVTGAMITFLILVSKCLDYNYI